MEKEHLSMKIDYVKPAALDLGPVTVAYGGSCGNGRTPTGGPDCTYGNSATGTCAEGLFASAFCRDGSGGFT